MKPFKEMADSKRFWATLTSIVTIIVVEFVPAMQGHEDMLVYILGAIGVYVLGQSHSDKAKYQK